MKKFENNEPSNLKILISKYFNQKVFQKGL